MQGSKTLSQRDAYAGAMKSAVKGTKTFGLIPKKFQGSSPIPVKALMPKKMSPLQVAKRKRTMLSNAATKMFSAQRSK